MSDASARRDILPRSLPPRGVSRVEAARYVGVSPTTFDAMIRDGKMPKPKRIGGRVVWDVKALDNFFEALPSDDGPAADVWSSVEA